MTNPASTVMGYWIGYTRRGGERKAAFYYANTDSSATQVRGSQRTGRRAVAGVEDWVQEHRGELVPGVPVRVRDMGGAY